MKWMRYLERQPEDGSIIIKCADAFELYDGDFKNNYNLEVTKYKAYAPWKEYVKWSRDNDYIIPNFWWIYAKDFPFPQ